MLDPNLYKVPFPVEVFDQYCAGGFHPVHLHDRFKDGRYEILNRLGYGAFSTVWLTRDHATERNVSIKIVVANGSETQNHELKILQHLQASDIHSHPGRSSVPQLLDSFFHEGPNGQHLCVVLEVLGPRVSWLAEHSRNYRLNPNLSRRISRRVVEAVAYLHSCGVAHGDIHMGNILLRLPPGTGAEMFGDPAPHQIEKVTKTDGSPLEEGVPEYLVEPLEHDISALDLNSGDVQLVDFGSAFFDSNPPNMINTPLSLHPPELVFRRPLTRAVDVWNLGCTVLGGVPMEWIREAVTDGVLAGEPDDDDLTDDCLPLESRIQKAYVGEWPSEELRITGKDLEKLVKYHRKMLVIDPEQRATAAELANDSSWIAVDKASEQQ
ncbi:kinase-like domain-containing protein [Corynascus similis CBS 632.67]